METSLFELATSQGIWVALFVFLFLYTIKSNEKNADKQMSREKDYQKTIESLTELLDNLTKKYTLIDDIKVELSFIKEKLEKNSLN